MTSENDLKGIGLIQLQSKTKTINGIWFSSTADDENGKVYVRLFDSSQMQFTLKDIQWVYPNEEISLYRYSGCDEVELRLLLCKEIIENNSLSLTDLYQRVVDIFTTNVAPLEGQIQIDSYLGEEGVSDPVLDKLEARLNSLNPQRSIKSDKDMFDKLIEYGFEKVEID